MCVVGLVLITSVSSALTQKGETNTTFSTSSKPFAGGDGSAENPYLIATPEQFNNIRYFMYHRDEAGEFDMSSPNYFLQIADLNFLLYDFNGDDEGNINPIGDSSSAFPGVYDGGNYVIENAQISSSADYVGLFGATTADAKIYNIGLKNSSIKSTGSGVVGGLVGNNQGLIKYSFNDASVAGNDFVGGIAGQNSGQILSCFNNGSLSGGQTGGIAGYNGGIVNGVYNSGAGAQGGVVHTYTAGTINNALYLSSVSSTAIYSGGESIDQTYVLPATQNQLACYEKMTINGASSYAIELLNRASTGEMPDYFYSYKDFYAYPQLWVNTYDNTLSLTGDGSSDNPFNIGSPQAMALIGKTYEVSELTQFSLNLNNDYVQSANLYFAGIDTNFNNPGTFTPIGLDESSGEISEFTGNYNGCSATSKTVKVTGLDIQSAHNNIALFATVGSGGVLNGLEIAESTITTSTTLPFNMAAFAATNNGTISNCVNRMSMDFIMSSTHDNGTNAAGIAASNSGRILLCANLGSISVYNPNNSTGASSFVSGIAASNSGDIERCYNAGYIMGGQTGGIAVVGGTGASITHSFNIGDLDCMLSPWSAGIICNGTGVTISYCYNLGHADYGISLYTPESQSYVYYLDRVADLNYFNGNSTDNLITANQLAGMAPLSGNSYFMDIFNAGGTFWEYDRMYTGSDGQPYQFAHLIDNKCELTYSYAMQISVDGYHIVDNTSKFNGISSRYNNIYYGGTGKYKVTSDLDFNGVTFNPKEDFSGELLGEGHTISNLYISSGSYLQLGTFTTISGNTKVNNLTFLNCGVTNNSKSADASAGILAGRMGLGVVVENIKIQGGYAQSNNNTGGCIGSITNLDSASGGYVNGCSVVNTSVSWVRAGTEPNHPTGGFVGWSNGGQISSCYYAHDDTSSGENSASVIGVWMVGGFVGVTDGNTNISNCFAYGSVYSDRQTTSASDDRDSVGGFVGINKSSSVSIVNCYAYVVLGGHGYRYSLDITKDNYHITRGFGHNKANGNFSNDYCYSGSNDLSNPGATELSADQMRTQSSFSGWDFNSVWKMSDSGSLPYGMPIPQATTNNYVQTGTITINTDGNVVAQAYKDGALVASSTSTSSGNLQFYNLAMGDYVIVLHRNGQTLSDASNYTSAENRGLEVINLSINDGSLNTSASSTKYFASGLGTESNPYIIQTFEQFLNIDKLSGQGTSTYYKLHSNIDANGQILTQTITNFMGHFDGNGYEISNFVISKNNGTAGLFEQLNNASIQNLGVSGFTITNYDQFSGFTGGLVGKAISSQVISSYSHNGNLNVNANAGSLVGYISGSTIKYCYATNNVTSLITEEDNYMANLGGFVGQAENASIIEQCYSDGNVTGTKRLGGFIAYAENVSISNSYTTVHTLTNYSGDGQSEVGGFAGYVGANSRIENCFMYGVVQNKVRELLIGAFIGENNSNNITNCYYWEVNNFPAIYQNSTSTVIESLSTVEFNQASSFGDFDFIDIWGMPSDDSQVSGSPILRNVVNAFKINEEILGEGTQFNPYIIFDANTFSEIMQYQDNYSGDGQVYFKLQKDIDLSEFDWTALGIQENPFTGVLLGNNKTISGLSFNSSPDSAYGLFAYTDGAVIQDLKINDFNLTVSTQQNVGSIVGNAYNTTFNNIELTQVNINSQGKAGSIVGESNGGQIENVYVSGCQIYGVDSAGGVVGASSQMQVSASTVTNSSVVASTNAGGFIGQMQDGSINSCISTLNTISGSYAGGHVGNAIGASILSVTTYNLTLQNAIYAGGVAGQLMQNALVNGANVYISNSISSTSAIGGIVGRGENSQIKNTNVNSNWSVAGTISSANVGGIIGYAVNMTNISYNKVANLILSPNSAGNVGQLYGALEGLSGATQNLYREITVSNDVGANFNNMTGTTVVEPVYEPTGTSTVNWILVA